MRFLGKITIVLALIGGLSLSGINTLFAQAGQDRSKKIAAELAKAGYTIETISSANIPMSSESYFVVTAKKGSSEFKIKVFGDKYFISGENGKLTPLDIGSAPSWKTQNKPKSAGFQAPKKTTGLTKSDLEEAEISTSPTINSYKNIANIETNTKPSETSGFLAGAEPRFSLASAKSFSSTANAVRNGCMPATFARIADFAMNLKDTTDVILKASGQQIVAGSMVTDLSKNFKRSKEESATRKIIESASQSSRNNPVSTSQSELEKKLNSEEMQRYSLKTLRNVLYRAGDADALTTDQMTAQNATKRLVVFMERQGKTKDEIYKSIGGQLKALFGGNISLTGTDAKQPWKMTGEDKLQVYSLVNNRDQVLGYAMQALTLKNDSIYQAKQEQLNYAARELGNLKRNITFESDNAKVKALEQKVEKLSTELQTRQKELSNY